MNTLAEELGHLKTHVKYPANKAEIVAACKGAHPGRGEDEAWVEKVLPEGDYKTPDEVLSALLQMA